MKHDIGSKRQDDFSERNPAVAIGIGCKRRCSSEAIVALVERALAAAACAGTPAALYTHEGKTGEAGLVTWPAAHLSRRPSIAPSLFTRRHELAKSDADVWTSIDRGGGRARRRGAGLCPARRAHERWRRKPRDRGQ